MLLTRARTEDVDELTEISRLAFEEHSRTTSPFGVSGPQGYNDPKFLRSRISLADCWKITLDDQTVGGAIVRQEGEGHFQLHRIWIHPNSQGRGVGRAAMHQLFQNYHDAQRWTLDTPEWAASNRYFYESLGFKETGCKFLESAGFNLILFERSSVIPDKL